jgi:hypothetical protein
MLRGLPNLRLPESPRHPERADATATAGRRKDSTAPVSSPYNTHRPHRSLDQRTPLAKPPINEPAPRAELPQLDLLRRRDRLGGLLREYRIAA